MSSSRIPLQIDHLKLARERTELSGYVPMDELARFAELLVNQQGGQRDDDQEDGDRKDDDQKDSVQAELSFRFKQDVPEQPVCVVIEGRLSAEVYLECQSCLLPYRHLLQTNLLLKVLQEEEDLMRLEDGLEDVVVCAGGEKLRINDIIEDELILGLPMIPRHELCLADQDYDVTSDNSSNKNTSSGHTHTETTFIEDENKNGNNMPFANLRQILNLKNRS